MLHTDIHYKDSKFCYEILLLKIVDLDRVKSTELLDRQLSEFALFYIQKYNLFQNVHM
jgi:hypothetical protein